MLDPSRWLAARTGSVRGAFAPGARRCGHRLLAFVARHAARWRPSALQVAHASLQADDRRLQLGNQRLLLPHQRDQISVT
jgi:hypothetical protein